MRNTEQIAGWCPGPVLPALILLQFGFCMGVLSFSASTCTAQGSPHPLQSHKTPTGTGVQGRAGFSEHTSLTYDQMIQHAKAAVSSRSEKGLLLCKQAIQRDPSRYEAHVVAAAALRQQKEFGQAAVHLQFAMALAPDEDKPTLSRAITEMKVASLPSDSRRKLDSLMLVLDDAQKAQSVADRERFLREFLTKSDDFLNAYPYVSDLWLLRAQVAIDLDEPALGWWTGRKLVQLGEDHSEDATTRRLMARVERNGWLSQNPADMIPILADAFNQKTAEVGIQRVDAERPNGQGGPVPVHDTAKWDSLSGTCETGLEATLESETTFSYTSPPETERTSSVIILNLKIGDPKFGSLLWEPGVNYPGFRLIISPLSLHRWKTHTEVIDVNGSVVSTKDGDQPTSGIEIWSFPSSNRANVEALAKLLLNMHQVCSYEKPPGSSALSSASFSE